MTTFFDLFVNHSSRPEFRDDPAWADRQFPALVASSPLRLWRPGDPIPTRDDRYLIGVATWSGYDMRLLDAIVEARAEQTIDPPPVVEVFNIADCRQPQDFDRYIGGIGAVLHTPVVGYWYDGQLIWSKQGHAAREVIADRFDFRSADIVAFVQDWIKARAHA